MKKLILLFIIVSFGFQSVYSQTKWKRSEPTTEPVNVFRSVEAIGLPTTETLKQGDIYFHISHKFLIPASEGFNELFGFDGGIFMRLALGYGLTDDLFLMLGRSNKDGNLDLQLKGKIFETNDLGFPLTIAANGGVGYNSKFANELEDKSRLWQYFGNVIINSRFGDFGVGVVPSFLYNSYIPCKDCQTSTTLGMYAQYFFNERWSVIAEANPTLNGWRQYYDTYSIGAEIETAGHFFKLSLSNNVYTNMSQFLGGASSAFDKGDLHICFLITRVL
jgi:hypothetical protein